MSRNIYNLHPYIFSPLQIIGRLTILTLSLTIHFIQKIIHSQILVIFEELVLIKQVTT